MWISTDQHPDLVWFDASESEPIDTDPGWKRYLDATTTTIADRVLFAAKFSCAVVSTWIILRGLTVLDQAGVL